MLNKKSTFTHIITFYVVKLLVREVKCIFKFLKNNYMNNQTFTDDNTKFHRDLEVN